MKLSPKVFYFVVGSLVTIAAELQASGLVPAQYAWIVSVTGMVLTAIAHKKA